MTNKIRIQHKLPQYAYRWFREFGETRQIVKKAGKAYAIGEDGKLVCSAEYVVQIGEGLYQVMNDGDWIIYEKNEKGDNIRVMSNDQFADTFKEYVEWEML